MRLPAQNIKFEFFLNQYTSGLSDCVLSNIVAFTCNIIQAKFKLPHYVCRIRVLLVGIQAFTKNATGSDQPANLSGSSLLDVHTTVVY